MSKMNPEIKTLWLTALRSGEYKQATGYLKRDTGDGVGYCCLGVLCEVAVSQGVKLKLDSRSAEVGKCGISDCDVCDEANDVIETRYSFDGRISYVPQAVQDWAGLEEYNPQVGYSYANSDTNSLATLNDGVKLDFNQIADIIEKNL